MGHKGLVGAKNLKFELGEKLDHRYTVKFHREWNGDSLETLNRCLDSEMGQFGKVRPPFNRKN